MKPPHDWHEKYQDAQLELQVVRAKIRRTSDRVELENHAIEEASIRRRLAYYAEQYAHAQSREQVDATTPPAAVVPLRTIGPVFGVLRGRQPSPFDHPRNRSFKCN